MHARRQLGLRSATALVVATMIGTGVFTTSGFLLTDLKSPGAVLAAWAVAGIIATLGALSYGALARRIPESGGEYRFLSDTLHPAAGYVAGWVSLVVGFAAPAAASAIAFGKYLGGWFPDLDSRLVGSAIILVFSGLHAAHVRRGAWVQNLGVAVNLVLMLGFIALALPRLPGASGPSLEVLPPAGMASTFAVSLIVISYSYAGWNAAVYIGGEIRHPERNLPRSLLWGTLLVTVLYFALNAVFVFSAPIPALAGRVEVGRIAAEHLGGPAWGNAVTALVALVLMTSVSSLVMAGPRICSQMAADGWLPHWLAPQEGPPRHAIVAQGILSLIMLATTTFEGLLTYVGLTLSLMTGATVAGLMVLRRREGAALSVPGWPWVPGLFLAAVLCSCGVTLVQRPAAALASLTTLALGWCAWRLSRARGKALA